MLRRAAIALAFVLVTLPAFAKTHTVVIDASSFTPASLTVKEGDTVVFVNKDFVEHTATSDDGAFDSDTIAPGKQWEYVAKKKGSYPYTCTFHPSMKGTLKVE
jgi:plastocyanin